MKLRSIEVEKVRGDVCREIIRSTLGLAFSGIESDRKIVTSMLQDKDFRQWIVRTGVFELFNRVYLQDATISSLHQKLRLLIKNVVTETIRVFREADLEPVIIKGTEIMERTNVGIVGRTNDLDLILDKGAIQKKASRLLRQNGWVQGSYEFENKITPFSSDVIRNMEVDHFEAAPFGKIFAVECNSREIDCIKSFNNGAFFKIVEINENIIYHRFDIDLHWNVMMGLDLTNFEYVSSAFQNAKTFDDTAHLYLMLLRTHYEAQINHARLRHAVLAICLLNNCSIDYNRLVKITTLEDEMEAVSSAVELIALFEPRAVSLIHDYGHLKKFRPTHEELQKTKLKFLGMS
jgi:hypothetical protein